MARVLVVDDEADIVLLARVNLELHGHEVRTAANGEEALVAVDEERPDAIVLDVMMPHLDGWGVLTRLKAHGDPQVRTIPVVMLAVLGTDHDQARGGIEGVVRYLTKPVVPGDLVNALHEVLAGPPEPEQRKAAQQKSLTSIARTERAAAPVAEVVPAAEADAVVGEITPKQRELLNALIAAPSVSEAAAALGMSRSNAYASLRRVGRKVGVSDVSELRLLRDGSLDRALR